MSIRKSGVAALVGLTLVVSMVVGVASTSALTATELLQILIAAGVIAPDKVAVAQAALGAMSAPSTSGYVFNTNLTIGSRGADVTALQNLLGVSPATGYFGSITKAAVVKYQLSKGISPAAGYVGSITRAALNAGSVVGPTVPTGTNLMVSLAPTSPASGAVVAGQAIANLAEYTFTNTSASPAVVTNLTLARTGVSDDTTLVNVYLFDGLTRVTDAATVSTGKVTFNAGSGLFTIPAGTSRTISVKADIKAATNGQIVGVALTGVTANVAVSASYPISGATFTVAQGTMAGVSFNTTTSPSADNSSLEPQNDFIAWQNTVSVTTREVYLKSISFKQIGSVSVGDLTNFRLFVDGTQVASLASLDSNNYATFDLSAAPVKLNTGNRTIKMLTDVVGGSNKTFSFHLRQVSDVALIDSQLNQPVLAQANSTTFSDRYTGTQTIGLGTLTITKKSDSPSGNITLDSTNVSLGKFELKATGEPMKIENLRVGIVAGTATVGSIRNGSLFVDGVQVGSTQTIATTTGTTQYTEFSLGSSVIVYPGSPKILEVRTDIFDNDGTNSIVEGTALTARILAGSSNVLRMNALSYTANTLTDGNQLTVAVGGLSLSKYAAYGNQTTVVPQTNGYKIGAFTLTSSNGSEAIDINTIVAGIRQNGTTDVTLADLSNIYLKYGSNMTAEKASVSASSTWTLNYQLGAGATLPIEVWARLGANMSAATTTVVTLQVDGTTVGSSQSKTSTAIGQTITVQSGSISAAAVNDSSVATKLVVGGSTVKVASYRITALYDTYTVKNIAVKTADTTNGPSAISGIILKNGSTQLGNVMTLNSSGVATSSDIALSIPTGSTGKVVDVYAVLNNVGTGAATTTANVALTLEGFKHETSGGTPSEYATDKTSNAMYLVKSAPTLTNMMSDGTLVAGSQKVIAKVKVSADAAGPIKWKKFVFTVNKSATVTVGATSTMELIDSNGNTVAGVFATTTGAGLVGGLDALDAATSDTVSFVATSEQEVVTSETYSLRTTLGGTWSGYTYIEAFVDDIASAIATPNVYATTAGAAGTQTPAFVWSDVSADNHSESTPDWINDYKVVGVPTGSGTLSVTI